MSQSTHTSLTARLKDDNWDLHQIAERRSDLALILRGLLPRERYIGLLGQAWLQAGPMDEALRGACHADPRIRGVVEDDQFFAPHARADLVYFEHATPEASPGTARFVAFVREHAADAMTILGLHYVRLGACNGNRFIAKKARAAYGLPESGEGTQWLDPFGQAQRSKWQAFKDGLDAAGWSDAERGVIFAGARAMYLFAINDRADTPATEAELLAAHGHELDKDAFAKSHAVVEHAASPGHHLGLTE